MVRVPLGVNSTGFPYREVRESEACETGFSGCRVGFSKFVRDDS
jgi:hypothetical protein